MKFEMLFLAWGKGSRVKNICQEKWVNFKCRLKIPGIEKTFLDEILEHRIPGFDSKVIIPKGRCEEFFDIPNIVEQKLPSFTRETDIAWKLLSYFSTQLWHILTGYCMNDRNTHLVILPTDLYLPSVNIEKFINSYKDLNEKWNFMGALLIWEKELDYKTHFLDMVQKIMRKTHFNPGIYIFPKHKISQFPLNLVHTPLILHSQQSKIVDWGNPKTFE